LGKVPHDVIPSSSAELVTGEESKKTDRRVRNFFTATYYIFTFKGMEDSRVLTSSEALETSSNQGIGINSGDRIITVKAQDSCTVKLLGSKAFH
jgi:hypothetical protein